MALRTSDFTRRLHGALLALFAVGLIPPAVWFVRRNRPGPPPPPPPPAAYWIADDSVAVRADAEPQSATSIWDGRTIRLAGMRNEVVAWQILARPSAYVDGARVAVSPLRDSAGRRLPADDHLKIFHANTLAVSTPSQLSDGQPIPGGLGAGEYPCQLLPVLGDLPFNLPPGQVSTIWCDYWIPADAAPGVYRGSVALRLAEAGEQRFELELRVYDLTMPAEIHYPNWFVLDPEQLSGYYEERGAMADALLVIATRLARAHRACALPALRLEPPDRDFDNWYGEISGLLSSDSPLSGPCAGAPPPFIPLELPLKLEPVDAERVSRHLVQGFRKEGLLDRCFVVAEQPLDEPYDADSLRLQGLRLNSLVAEALPLLAEAPVDLEADPDHLLDAVDWFCWNDVTAAEQAQLTKLGHRYWVSDGALGAPPLLDQPLLGIVAWGAQAWRERVAGHRIWSFAYWRQRYQGVQTYTDLYHDPLTVNEGRPYESAGSSYHAGWARRLNGDGVWIYPGPLQRSRLLVPSLRLKAFRRAAQDYEYLWMLKQAGRGRAADAYAARLSAGRGQWEEDPAEWNKVRREMAALLLETKRR